MANNPDLIGLVLSALLADDAQTAADLATAIDCTTHALRPALRQLVAAGALVTSGLGRGTRYVLAIEEQEVRATHATRLDSGWRIEFRPSVCGGGKGWACRAVSPDDRAEHWIVYGPELPRSAAPVRRSRPPQIPATIDLLGDLTRTAERIAAGQTLREMAASIGSVS